MRVPTDVWRTCASAVTCCSKASGGALPGSTDLRLYEAELWAKYAGAVDYDQRHHRDFVNHSLVVPYR